MASVDTWLENRYPHKDWTKIYYRMTYAHLPSIIDPYMRIAPSEIRARYEQCRLERPNFALRDNPMLVWGGTWPRAVSSAYTIPQEILDIFGVTVEEIEDDAKNMTFKQLKRKYGFFAEMNNTPFMDRRIVPKAKILFDCNAHKGMTEQQILDAMRRLRYRTRPGGYHISQLPILHANTGNFAMKSWMYN